MAYTKAFTLALGVGLSAEQMASLTTDIVLLVDVTVQAPSGSQHALAPVVYLAATHQGDLASSGALIASGGALSIRTTGNLTNGGVLASGGPLSVTAGGDLLSQAGRFKGTDVTLSAGNNLVLGATSATTHTATAYGASGLTTDVKTHQVSVVDASGKLAVIARGNLTSQGAQLSAGDTASLLVGGTATLGAVNDQTNTLQWGPIRHGSTSTATTEQTVRGTAIAGVNGVIVAAGLLDPGAMLSLKGGSITSGVAIAESGTGGVDIGATTEHDTSATAAFTRRSGLLSTTRTSDTDTVTQDVAVGSLVSGGSVSVGSSAGRIGITGSTVAGDGDVTIDSGGALSVMGSQVAAAGTTSLSGQSVTIANATDTVDTASRTKSSSFGLSVGVQSPIIDGISAAARMGQTAASASDTRAQAVAALAGGLGAYNAVDSASQAVPGAVKALGAGKVGNALTSLGQVNVSIGGSSSLSTSATHDESMVASTVSGNSVAITACGTATDPASGTIAILGSNVLATRDAAGQGGNVTLIAPRAITIASALEASTATSTNKSWGFSLGVSAGAAGITPNASFNSGKGDSQGVDLRHVESLVRADHVASVTTPGALTIRGGSLQGDLVRVDAGSLAIIGEQDSSTFASRQSSIGLSLSAANGGTVGGSLSRDKANGSFGSVAEQSGIYAGQGGFDLRVKDATTLTGGVIASTADASRNRLSTGTLSATDLTITEQYRASSLGLSLGLSGVGSIGRNVAGAADAGRQDTKLPGVPVKGLGTLSAGLPTALSAHGGQTGVTSSAVAPGSIAITSGDAASLATAATIGRDTGTANAGALVQRFDADRRAEIETSFAATRELANQTAIFFQNRGADEQRLRDQAKALAGSDPSAARGAGHAGR